MEEQIVNAALVMGRSSIYCIGSFAKKVNFSAQQYRALNLVWALAETGRIDEGDQIAIIGAGLSGLTLAAAFMAYGCIVHVYESGNGSISRQTATNHRLVHPTINRWPQTPTEVTTELPFLEWYIGYCDEVTNELNEQFSDLLNEGSEVVTEAKVIDLVEMASDNVRVVTSPSIKDKRDVVYKMAVIAVGYGTERKHDPFDLNEYWEPDSLENARDTGKYKHFIVSGCGDGGAIDALRIVHTKFAKGMLAFKVAAMLDYTGVAKVIEEGEEAALKKKPADLKTGLFLQPYYMKALDLLMTDPAYKPALDILNESVDGFHGVVYLADEVHEAPFSITAAPIHKLLIAHAMRRGRIKFEKGSVKMVGADVELDSLTFTKDEKPKVVIRHGADKKFDRLLKREEAKDLERKQGLLSDDHAKKAWTKAYKVHSHLPVHDPTTVPFMVHRKPLALKALKSLGFDFTLGVEAQGYSLSYSGAPPVMAPRQLFGIPIVPEPEQELRVAS